MLSASALSGKRNHTQVRALSDLTGERQQIELIYDIDYEARQVIFGQPIVHSLQPQQRRCAIYRTE